MFTLGTAGHIDHGKTTLCRHLTGVDTDRLDEERRRGISIELGFAHLVTHSGVPVGIVDVPGHERFIRTMVAGVSGIDAALFVVAADEGLMPQTYEHFHILRLLGIDHGIVVMTRCDLADDDMRTIVRDDLRSFLASTQLATAAIVETAANDPSSFDPLRSTIDALVNDLVPRRRSGHFRLPVDRVFSLRGHGTIVTGTVAAGSVHRGETVELQPEGLSSRIRNIQVFGESTDVAQGGQRTALNLPDIPTSVIQRGTNCCTKGVFTPTSMVDGRVEMVAGLPSWCSRLVHDTRIRFHVGTAEVMGRISLLDCKALTEGSAALAQFRLERPIIAARGDRFLVRSFSPILTIAGGMILDGCPRRHRNRASASSQLRKLSESDTAELILHTLDNTNSLFMTGEELSHSLSLPRRQIDQYLPPANVDAGIIRVETPSGEMFHAEGRLYQERRTILETVTSHHEEHPSAPGIDKASLRQRAAVSWRSEAFKHVIDQLLDAGDLVSSGRHLRRAGFEPRLDPTLSKKLEAVRRLIEKPQELIWTPQSLVEETGASRSDMSRIIGLLLNDGSIVRLPGGTFGSAQQVHALTLRVVDIIRDAGGEADTTKLKAGLGLTRKHLIPLLEHLDETGTTIRAGNVRRLRSAPASGNLTSTGG